VKTAGIAIDAWKLEIFRRHLAQAAYQFEEGPGLTEGTLWLKVRTTDVLALGKVVKAANDEAALSRLPR
jgi:hypothetical protein